MSHNILENDIQTGIKMAWHGLTNVVKKITRENSGIAYHMTAEPIYYVSARKKQGAVERPIYSQAPGKVLVCGDGVCIGQISDTFAVITHGQIWDGVEEGLQGTGHKIVSCGTVQNRQLGFISVELNSDFLAAGRNHESMLNLLWGNTGKMEFKAKFGSICVVCNNTFNWALQENGEEILRVKHTKNKALQIENLGQVIDKAIGVQAEFQAAMDTFEETEIKESEAKRIYAGLIAPRHDAPLSTRAENTVERLVQLYRGGAGNKGETLADVFGGITDYYSHESSGGENRWKQYVSSEFGAGDRMKTRAFEIFRKPEAVKEIAKRGEHVLALTS